MCDAVDILCAYVEFGTNGVNLATRWARIVTLTLYLLLFPSGLHRGEFGFVFQLFLTWRWRIYMHCFAQSQSLDFHSEGFTEFNFLWTYFEIGKLLVVLNSAKGVAYGTTSRMKINRLGYEIKHWDMRPTTDAGYPNKNGAPISWS
jgi:hypothetical protein